MKFCQCCYAERANRFLNFEEVLSSESLPELSDPDCDILSKDQSDENKQYILGLCEYMWEKCCRKVYDLEVNFKDRRENEKPRLRQKAILKLCVAHNITCKIIEVLETSGTETHVKFARMIATWQERFCHDDYQCMCEPILRGS